MLRLHAMKQKLLGDSRKKDGIKWHMILHVDFYTEYFGPPYTFDMIRYEGKHGSVKFSFSNTSQRFGTTEAEILRKQRIATVVTSTANVMLAEEDRKEREFVQRKIARTDNVHTTDTGIVFESPRGQLSRHEIFFDTTKDIWSWRGNNCPFMSPLLKEETLNKEIKNYMIASESPDEQAKTYNGEIYVTQILHIYMFIKYLFMYVSYIKP